MNHRLTSNAHSSGHPWYYLLGGTVLTPKQIRCAVINRGYQGYLRDDIAAADKKAEPQRSQALKALQRRALDELQRDLNGYRRRALDLHRYRATSNVSDSPVSCHDVHTAISLKHNHLINDFAHLITLDRLLTKQGELFG